MKKLGVIKEIWQFPVKSMQGNKLQTCTVSTEGIAGDRGWVVRDEVREEIQWGKKHPQLMQCRARYRDRAENDDAQQPVDIYFPDGQTLGSDGDAMQAKLTELLGFSAKLWPLQPADNLTFYKRYSRDEQEFAAEMVQAFARQPGEPMPDLSQFPEVLLDYVSIPGTFFDNEELNLVTTASISYLASKNPAANWDIRRFRPNFLVETVPGLEGLVENDWVGKRLKIGDVILDISAPTPRCGMTVRPQDDLPFDKSVLRTIVKEANQNLGVGAHCGHPGTILVGDSLEIIE
ncbi:MAG: MOSC domain-containing protein [Gammaproteobacteria bacterium]|nr:MOSC domain-containing protein [Gammaproteobacteria bacterium]